MTKCPIYLTTLPIAGSIEGRQVNNSYSDVSSNTLLHTAYPYDRMTAMFSLTFLMNYSDSEITRTLTQHGQSMN